jgi:hypothetical protein
MTFIKHELTTFYRNADFGNSYDELHGIYPDWSIELHNYGNYLENEKLEIIASKGLISWYCSKELYNINIYYPYIEKLNNFILYPENIEYYDWTTLCKLCYALKIDRPIFTNYNFYKTYKYNFIDDMFPSKKEYYQIKFGKILLNNYSKSVICDFLNIILKRLDLIKLYFEKENIIDTFLYYNNDIKILGIIYHRLKIILEKMIENKNIYLFDHICDDNQTYIYSWVKNYCSNLLLTLNPIKLNLNDLQCKIYDLFLNKIYDKEINTLEI